MIQKALLYCTKRKLFLRKSIKDKDYYLDNGSEFNIIPKKDYVLNGKIVAECDFEVEEIEKGYGTHHASFDEKGCFDDYYDYMTKTIDEDILLKRSCLNVEELETYNPNYAIHIKNLKIFDEPRELSDYTYFGTKLFGTLGNAPQNIMYAYDVKSFNNFEKKILISIRPQWLCKILNGEKTIEVRRKVLREMIK